MWLKFERRTRGTYFCGCVKVTLCAQTKAMMGKEKAKEKPQRGSVQVTSVKW